MTYGKGLLDKSEINAGIGKYQKGGGGELDSPLWTLLYPVFFAKGPILRGESALLFLKDTYLALEFCDKQN